jgi:hypothetical protein
VQHTIVTHTRGDGARIGEWVEYHARLGFDDFQVILDGLVDDTDEVLQRLDVPARITVHRRAEDGDYYDGLGQAERMERVRAWRVEHADLLASLPYKATDPQSLRQFRRVAEVLEPYQAGERGRGWVAHIDADEFIAIPGGRGISDVTSAATAPRLQLLNFNVDTSGHDPARPVLEQHRLRWSREDVLAHPDPRWGTRVKAIVRYRCALPFRSIHRISFGRSEVLDPEVARLHHFRVPNQLVDPEIPYSVDDPLTMPAAR